MLPILTTEGDMYLNCRELMVTNGLLISNGPDNLVGQAY